MQKHVKQVIDGKSMIICLQMHITAPWEEPGLGFVGL